VVVASAPLLLAVNEREWDSTWVASSWDDAWAGELAAESVVVWEVAPPLDTGSARCSRACSHDSPTAATHAAFHHTTIVLLVVETTSCYHQQRQH
jgi:hypothetical protein